MKRAINFVFLCLAFLIFAFPVRADYMLPYPSYLPGNKLYPISKLFEKLEYYWFWGNIGKTKYDMMLADKYLVEAKTLFEYKQYVLAIRSLALSDQYIAQVPEHIEQGKKEGKDMTQFQSSFFSELGVHAEILRKLQAELPKTFVWAPEKAEPTTLNIENILTSSTALRDSLR